MQANSKEPPPRSERSSNTTKIETRIVVAQRGYYRVRKKF